MSRTQCVMRITQKQMRNLNLTNSISRPDSTNSNESCGYHTLNVLSNYHGLSQSSERHELNKSHEWNELNCVGGTGEMGPLVAHMNGSCQKYKWVVSYVWKGHVEHINEPCQTHVMDTFLTHVCCSVLKCVIVSHKDGGCLSHTYVLQGVAACYSVTHICVAGCCSVS